VSSPAARAAARRWTSSSTRMPRPPPPRRASSPNGAAVLGEDGDEIGGVLVLVDAGRLATLEVYSFGDPIAAFPPTDRLRPAAPQ
jgi:hypothetical protein